MGSFFDWLSYPFTDPQQRFEIRHQTERSLAAQFAMIPVSAISNRIMDERAAKKSFEFAAYEYLENVFTRTTFADIVRSWTLLYGRDRKFKHAINVADKLHAALAQSQEVDCGAFAHAVHEGYVSPLHDLKAHGDEAAGLIGDLVRGERPTTPEELKTLQRHLQGMAMMARQRSTLLRQGMEPFGKTDPAQSTPADLLRHALTTKRIDGLKEAQLILALMPCLITHGITQLGRVDFIPQEQRFLTPRQAQKLADASETLLAEHLPNRPVTSTQIIACAERMQRALHSIVGPEMQRILLYADQHFEAVERQFEPPTTASAKAPAWKPVPPKPDQLFAERNEGPQWMRHMVGFGRGVELTIQHLGRSEAKHEMAKLFGRQFVIQLSNLPVNAISDYILTAGSKVKRPILKKELWALAANPVTRSYISTPIRELTKTGNALAQETLDGIDHVLEAGIAQAARLSSAYRQALDSSRNIAERIRADVPFEIRQDMKNALALPQAAWAQPQFDAMGSYYEALQHSAQQVEARIAAPFLSGNGGIEASLAHGLQGAGSVEQAAASLALLRSILKRDGKTLHSLEYVPPEEHYLTRKALHQVAERINDQIAAAGFAIHGAKYVMDGAEKAFRLDGRDFADGQLLRWNSVQHRFDVAQPEDIVQLANMAAAVMRSEFSPDKGGALAAGKIDGQTLNPALRMLYNPNGKEPELFLAPNPSASRPWAVKSKPADPRSVLERAKENVTRAVRHASRPEARHEMQLLYWRMFYARVVGIPVGIWQKIRRGYLPVDKETGTWRVNHDFKLLDAITHPQHFISKQNFMSELFQAFAYPLMQGIGAIFVRELVAVPEQAAIEEEGRASQALRGLIHRIADNGATCIELAELLGQPLGVTENSTAHLFEMRANVPSGKQQVFTRLLHDPVSNPAQAALVLSMSKTLMDLTAKSFGVIRYIDPKEQLFDRDKILALSDFVGEQLAASGLNKAEHLPADDIVRFSNLVRDRLLQCIDRQKLVGALSETARRDQVWAETARNLSI